jgi:hypothetical protein
MAGQDHREECSCRGQIASFRNVYVDDLAVLVNRSIYVPPNTRDFHVGLINEPAVTNTVTAFRANPHSNIHPDQPGHRTRSPMKDWG